MPSTKRIEALGEFGYSPRDATFLCLAALHSGFFLRRQYRLSAGINPGRADDNFINKLYYHGHVRVLAGKANLRIHHLSCHPFYRTIGEGDNRHRRMRPMCAIKVKLMALDYVLAHPEESFLATEEEKVEYFTRKLGIDAACLPTKIYHAKTEKTSTRRFFVDKFPIALPPEAGVFPAVVSFCYIDGGEIATPAFETWLRQYSRLFAALKRFRVIFVATSSSRFRQAEQEYRRFVDHPHQLKIPSKHRLLAYFHLEHLYRSRRFEELDTRKLEELRQLRKEFRGEKYEQVFEQWKARGDRFAEDLSATGGHLSVDQALFETFRLEWNYDILGTR
jgi:hypothetical protein